MATSQNANAVPLWVSNKARATRATMCKWEKLKSSQSKEAVIKMRGTMFLSALLLMTFVVVCSISLMIAVVQFSLSLSWGHASSHVAPMPHEAGPACFPQVSALQRGQVVHVSSLVCTHWSGARAILSVAHWCCDSNVCGCLNLSTCHCYYVIAITVASSP